MREIRPKSSENKRLFVALLLLILLAELWRRQQQLDTLVWGADEGIHLMVAKLAIAGYRPYSEVFFSQLPVFFEAVRQPLQWFDSVTAVRWSISIFGILELVAVAVLGRRLGGNLAGLSAIIFLALTPSFFYYSRSVMADIPSVALSLWAIWAALRYQDDGQSRWLMISGVLLGISLAAKFLTIYAVGWIGLLILQYHWRTTANRTFSRTFLMASLRDGLIFGLSTGLAVAGILVWYSPTSLLPAGFGMRTAMREAFATATPLADDMDVFVEFWQLHLPLILLALYGLAAQYKQRARFWLLAAWPALVLLMLLNHTPLHRQHFQLLPPILALLAGLGVVAAKPAVLKGIDFVKSSLGLSRHEQGSPPEQGRTGSISVWSLGGLLLLSWYIGSIWLPTVADNPYTETFDQLLSDDEQALVDFIQRFTSPTDCLVTDNLTLAYLADRLVPPSLSDVSSARLRSGNLTYETLVSATEQSQCQVVMPIASRLKRSRSDYVDWAKKHFLGLWLPDGHSEIILNQPLTQPQPQQPLAAILADQVELVGYDLLQAADDGRGPVYVSLYWNVLQPFGDDYTVFVHLQDDQNNMLANADHQPYNNLVPTTRWPAGATIKDTIRLDLPDDLPAGTYQITVGLYLPATLERLSVRDDTSGENAVMIGPIEVR